MYLIWNTEDYLGHNYNNWIHFATGPLDGSAWSDEQLMDNQCNSSSKYSSIWTAGDNVDLLMSNNTAVFRCYVVMFVAVLVLFLSAVRAALRARFEAGRPNTLLVMLYDAGFMDFGAYGSDLLYGLHAGSTRLMRRARASVDSA